MDDESIKRDLIGLSSDEAFCLYRTRCLGNSMQEVEDFTDPEKEKDLIYFKKITKGTISYTANQGLRYLRVENISPGSDYCRLLTELVGLLGSPPDWSKWPPPTPTEMEIREADGSELEPKPTPEGEPSLEPGKNIGEVADESDPENEFVARDEGDDGIDGSEANKDEAVGGEEPEEPLILPLIDQPEQPRRFAMWQIIIGGILVVALLFGLWRGIQTIRGLINPITGESLQTPQPVPGPFETQLPTADSQIAAEQTLTARAPTPDPVQTQAAFETEVAINVAATETAAVTDTPTATPTSTLTPTPTWTPSPTLTPSPVPPPPTDNLALYLPLDGNATDESGNGLDGQVNGATLTEGRNNEPDTAYFFNGVSSIVIPDSLELRGNTYPLTVAVWLNIVRTNGVNAIITKFQNASAKDWGLRVDDDVLIFASENGNNPNADFVCRQTLGTVPPNEWHLVAFVANEPNLLLYLDGVVVGSCSDFEGKWIDTEHPVDIGLTGYRPDHNLVGAIDEIWIWNKALSSEEMLSLYQFTK